MGAKTNLHSVYLIGMPIYEFRCNNCNHKFEIYLTYQEYGNTPITCPSCDHSEPERIIKPVRVARSGAERFDDLADPAKLAGLDDDPQTLGKMMRQMSQELGEDMGPEFDEVVNRLERGQSPEDIERDIPDLGGIGEDNPD
jgi:putative FmdB family regulatory protein